MPRWAGDGYEFVPVGELVRDGDERWHRVKCVWVPAVNTDGITRVRVEKLYRRRVIWEEIEGSECDALYVISEDNLLDKFAMSALTGLLASGYWQTKITDGALPIAQNAWNIAKAMIQTRGPHEN